MVQSPVSELRGAVGVSDGAEAAAGPRERREGSVGGWREALAAGALATVWSLAERGFAGGRWWDLPGIKSFIDPRLYRQDPFVWTLHNGTPAAYPYQLIAALASGLPFLSLDQVLLLLYLPVTLAALTLLYRIGLRLSGSRAAAALFLVLYVAGFRLVTIGSSVLHSAETTPQTLALPLQLGAIYALLVGRTWPAGLLMGLAFNLHMPSTVLIAAAVGLYLVLSARRLGVEWVALAFGLMALAGGPALAGSLLHHGDQLPLWALYMARLDTATDVSFATNFTSRALIAYNLLGFGLVGLVVRAAPADAGRRLTLIFFLAVGLLCLGALVFFDAALQFSMRTPLTTVVTRLQLPRSAWLLNVLGLLYLARYLVAGWRTGSPPRSAILLIVAAMLAAEPEVPPIDPLWLAAGALVLASGLVPRARTWPWLRWAAVGLALAAGAAALARLGTSDLDFGLSPRTLVVLAGLGLGWGLYGLLRRRVSVGWRAAVPAVTLALLVAAGLQRADEWRYAAAHRGGLSSAAAFQEWARTQTPVDSVFLLLPSEPNNQAFYRNADRAVFLVRERANQALYFREHNVEFERRVKALGVDQPLRYREDLDAAYRRLTEDQVRALARDFGVTHFVPARAGSFSFPIVYQSGGWTVYAVTP